MFPCSCAFRCPPVHLPTIQRATFCAFGRFCVQCLQPCYHFQLQKDFGSKGKRQIAKSKLNIAQYAIYKKQLKQSILHKSSYTKAYKSLEEEIAQEVDQHKRISHTANCILQILYIELYRANYTYQIAFANCTSQIK